MAKASRANRAALFCDTNVLVRLLSGEPPDQAEASERALRDPDTPIVLTDLIVAELAYVLIARAKMTPAAAAAEIRRILELGSVEVASEALLVDALDIWAATGVDFADAYLAAITRQTRGTAVLSFDRDFDRIDGVDRVDPATY